MGVRALPGELDDPPDPHPALGQRVPRPEVKRLGDHRVRHPYALERVRPELEFGVPHVLRREVSRHPAYQVGDARRPRPAEGELSYGGL